jgi:23S rRNA pseudouridine2457 synthase
MPLILFNKPYGVVCQFSPSGNRLTLKDFVTINDIYPAGRLDADSEGLIILTDDGQLQRQISHPNHKLPKIYLAQVEGIPTEIALRNLRTGIVLKDGPTLPADVRLIVQPPNLWPRQPPIRFRKNIPSAWIEVILREGRNRQLRRMTAAIGHPTLRLIRWQIGDWSLTGLKPGDWKEITVLT